jgi:hypothetical protein
MYQVSGDSWAAPGRAEVVEFYGRSKPAPPRTTLFWYEVALTSVGGLFIRQFLTKSGQDRNIKSTQCPGKHFHFL